MALGQQGVYASGDLTFFSNFDSGNLAGVERRPGNWVTSIQFELWVGADAGHLGHTAYRVWFYFGLRGLTKGANVRFTVMNFSGMKNLFGNRYKIVWTTQPGKDLWLKLPFEINYEQLPGNNARVTWDFEAQESAVHYFAFAYPYSLDKLDRMLREVQANAPSTAYIHRETLIYTPQNRPVELISITDNANLREESEESLPHLFPTDSRARR